MLEAKANRPAYRSTRTTAPVREARARHAAQAHAERSRGGQDKRNREVVLGSDVAERMNQVQPCGG
jgi:hypothetical protein